MPQNVGVVGLGIMAALLRATWSITDGACLVRTLIDIVVANSPPPESKF